MKNSEIKKIVSDNSCVFCGHIVNEDLRKWFGKGGAGGAGATGSSNNNDTVAHGGIGIQLPATFRDPISSVGAPGPSGNYWVAGGGGGGASTPTQTFGEGGGAGGPYAGAGPAGDGEWYAPGVPYATGQGTGIDAKANSGSGGGGNSVASFRDCGKGGSGIVLVAYPS